MTAARKAPSALRAGAAQVDITPDAGVQVAGHVGVHRPAKFVEDPIYAKALVLESAGRKLCLVALDVTIITRRHADEIRRAAVERFGFEYDAVMVHATQTHSAPALGHFILTEEFEAIPPEFDWLRGGDERYNAFAVERTIEAVRLANESLEPVQVGAASGIEYRMAFNRRAVMRDGMVQMPPPRWSDPDGPARMRYMEGPIDPEVGVVCLRRQDLRMPAILANYTCHPVHVFPKPIISPDWPGALADELRSAFGRECVALVTNGACGNVNPWPPFDPDYVEDHRRMGRVLAGVVRDTMERITFRQEAVLDRRARRLAIPLREIEPERLEAARKVLAEQPAPRWADDEHTYVAWEWMRAAGLVDLANLREREPELDYEVQVFRVGDAALVGLPGEPFVEGGLRIKLASPAYPTYVLHCTNQYVGYIPVREAFARGGHEVVTSPWSKLAPEALDMVVDAATGLLREVFAE